MVLGVMPAGLGVVVFGVAGVSMRAVSVMGSQFMIAGFVMFGGFAMMFCRVLVMFGGTGVMMSACMRGHGLAPKKLAPVETGIAEPRQQR
jgi:hypothetical protein